MPGRGGVTAGLTSRQWWLAGAACVIGGALTLLSLSQPPTPDPNSWLVWAQQIAAGKSLDFSVGPSWKPLPVMIATPLSVVSTDAALLGWMLLTRVAALMVSFLLFRLVRPSFGLFAGIAAAILPFAIPAWFAVSVRGYTEPICVACLLGAALAWVAGNRRFGIWLLVIATLTRPEAAAFLLPFAWWGIRSGEWRDRLHLVGAAATLAAGWMLMPWIVGGHLLQASERAQEKVAFQRAHGIIAAGLEQLPAWAWLLIPIGVWGVWRIRDRGLVIVSLGAAAWLIGIELMYLAGYSGINRYFLPGIVASCALAGAGVGVICAPLAGSRSKPLLPGRAFGAFGSVLSLGLVVASLVIAAPADRRLLRQSQLVVNAADAAGRSFDAAGGLGRFGHCTPFATEGLFARILARRIGVSLPEMQPLVRGSRLAEPGQPAVAILLAPRAIGQAQAATGSPAGQPVVLPGGVGGWSVVYAPGRCAVRGSSGP